MNQMVLMNSVLLYNNLGAHHDQLIRLSKIFESTRVQVLLIIKLLDGVWLVLGVPSNVLVQVLKDLHSCNLLLCDYLLFKLIIEEVLILGWSYTEAHYRLYSLKKGSKRILKKQIFNSNINYKLPSQLFFKKANLAKFIFYQSSKKLP